MTSIASEAARGIKNIYESDATGMIQYVRCTAHGISVVASGYMRVVQMKM